MQRVLVVDDELMVARSLERWLTRRGVEVVVLTDVTEFELVFTREAPTLVICDYLMPGMNGVAVLTLARRLAPEVRRCLLSASQPSVTAAQRASIEPCLFIDKPWDSATFAKQLGLDDSP